MKENKREAERLLKDLKAMLDVMVLDYSAQNELNPYITEEEYMFETDLVDEIVTGKVRGVINHLERQVRNVKS